MPSKQRKQFLSECEPVELTFGQILCEPDRPYQNVYFPVTGFISLVAVVAAHPPLEMGLIGNEGMLGVTLVLGIGVAPLRAVVQGAGSAWRMTAASLSKAMRENPGLVQSLNRYLYVLMAQLSQTAACTRFHEIDARLARWLLMTHDRAHADHFHLTHQYLADMLGVQRSAITIAAGALQRRKLISYTRGDIRILSRKGLEATACECYAAVIKDYAQRFA
jgi:CRP-like cAMP-binding protein